MHNPSQRPRKTYGGAINGTAATTFLGKSLMLRTSCLSAFLVGLLLLVPAVASADEYLVTSCHDPGGQPNAAAGWVPLASGDGRTTNSCPANGALIADLNSQTPSSSSSASWRFSAPPATRIVRLLGSRSTFGFGPPAIPQDVAYNLTINDAQALERCQYANDLNCAGDLSGPVDKPGLTASTLEFRVLCTNGGRNCSKPASVTIANAWVVLQDPFAPVVANANIDSGESSGTLRATFDAVDAGGGLYRLLVKVDGKIRQAIPLGPAPCADVAPTDPDPYQFNVPVPCPAAVNGASAALDVRSLPPGPHGVEIAVEDAAGNQTSVVGPVEFPKPNVASGSAAERVAALTGRLRMWFVKSRRGDRKRLSSRFGHRVVTRGVLRARNGRGIVGARIDVYHIRRDGSRRLVKTGLKSRRGGALTLILPNNVDTRTIEFAYRALRPGPITSRQRLRLTVRTKSGRIYHRKSSGRR